MTERVRVKDTGWSRIAKMLRAAAEAKSYVKVGFVGPAAEHTHGDDGLTNGELAIIHEFGAPRAGIPARPFIGPTFDKNRKKYQDQIAKNVRQTFQGDMTMDRLLELIGAEAAADVKAYVTQGAHIPPPLQPETIAAKGSDRPLVDTGQMINSVTWELKKGSGE